MTSMLKTPTFDDILGLHALTCNDPIVMRICGESVRLDVHQWQHENCFIAFAIERIPARCMAVQMPCGIQGVLEVCRIEKHQLCFRARVLLGVDSPAMETAMHACHEVAVADCELLILSVAMMEIVQDFTQRLRTIRYCL